MSNLQYIADERLRSSPEGVSPALAPEYDTSPEVVPIPPPEPAPVPGPELGYYHKEPNQNIILEAPTEPIYERKLWGMKRKTLMTILAVFIILIVGVAAGVGGGVAATAAKSNNNKAASAGFSPSPTLGNDHAPIMTVTASASSTPTPIFKNTPLAAVNWNNSALQLFYKHPDGTIRFKENNGVGWGKQQSEVIITPRNDSGIAAVGWVDESTHVRQVRVYTVSEDNILTETIWNSAIKTWDAHPISGELDPPAAGSQLTANTWFEGTSLHIRVYYQGVDGYIREAAFVGTMWTRGAATKVEDFPRAKDGSGLAAVLFPYTDSREAKLYYQSMEGKLVSYDYKPTDNFTTSWQYQNASIDHGYIPDRAQLTAVATRAANTLRIYFIQDGKLKEVWWEPKNGWRKAFGMKDAVAPGIAAISFLDDVRVFFQYTADHLSALGLNQDINEWEFSPAI